MTIPEQISPAAIFYFTQVSVFRMLIDKNVLEWLRAYSEQIYKTIYNYVFD